MIQLHTKQNFMKEEEKLHTGIRKRLSIRDRKITLLAGRILRIFILPGFCWTILFSNETCGAKRKLLKRNVIIKEAPRQYGTRMNKRIHFCITHIYALNPFKTEINSNMLLNFRRSEICSDITSLFNRAQIDWLAFLVSLLFIGRWRRILFSISVFFLLLFILFLTGIQSKARVLEKEQNLYAFHVSQSKTQLRIPSPFSS